MRILRTTASEYPNNMPRVFQTKCDKNDLSPHFNDLSLSETQFIKYYVRIKLNHINHIVRLTIWHHLFLKFWLVHIWLFAHWRHQRPVTRHENVRQLNIRRRKKLGFQLSQRKPPMYIKSQSKVDNFLYLTTKNFRKHI